MIVQKITEDPVDEMSEWKDTIFGLRPYTAVYGRSSAIHDEWPSRAKVRWKKNESSTAKLKIFDTLKSITQKSSVLMLIELW